MKRPPCIALIPRQIQMADSDFSSTGSRDLNPRDTSLLSKIGGEPVLNALVEIFYQKILLDDRVNRLFQETSIDKLITKQTAFLRYALEGSESYQGKSLREAHAHLSLNEQHWYAVIDDLIDSMHDLKVPGEIINEVLKVVGRTKSEILNEDL